MIIVVYGQPAPQGSKRGIIHRHTKRVVLIESSKKVKPWRAAVVRAARQKVITSEWGLGFDEPLSVSMVSKPPVPARTTSSDPNLKNSLNGFTPRGESLYLKSDPFGR